MTPEFAYFLKVNAALALFYAFYRLFFYRDTFFQLRRCILLAFFGLAFLYPLLNMQGWMREQEQLIEIVAVYASMMLPEVTVTADAATVAGSSFNWTELWPVLLSGVYLVLVVFLLLRFCIRLGSILWLGMHSKQAVIQGVPVHLLPQPAGPFSFFRYIFLHPGSHDEKETDEILTHEWAHVSQWHSIDVVVTELVTICCWFNPFVWLLKREVRHNLEYLADNRVIELGYDSRNYQYHLLGLALHHTEPSGLYNSFNVLHIKNRILMMNKKRSHGFGRTKYLFFLPLVLALMLLNNIGALARMTNLLTETNLPVENKVVLPEEETPVIATPTEQPAAETPRQTASTTTEVAPSLTVASQPTTTQPETFQPAEDVVFTVVEKMPEFPGGEPELLRFLNTNIQYPVLALENGIQGRVICTFIVSKEGIVKDAEVLRGVDPLLDKEALRVIYSMPKWSPGTQRGKPVTVKYTLPVIFRMAEPQAVAGDMDKDRVYTVIAHMPEFPGGESELLRFLGSRIKYPVDAQTNGVQGRVISSFTVNTDGSVQDIEILRGVDPSLDQEAMRVIAAMPAWQPGRHANGETARVKYTLPVIFRLQ